MPARRLDHQAADDGENRLTIHHETKKFMSQFYRTFKRSCTNWREFGSARKMTVETGLTYDQARERCQEYAKGRTAAQIRKGTMLEFTAE